MFLKTLHKNSFRQRPASSLNLQRQRGISLAFLLFVIIIVSLLAAALLNLNAQSNLANAQQVISTRAFFAAESGSQLQAMRLFPLNAGAANCSPQTFNFTIGGINGCTAQTTCNASLVNGTNFYTVTSVGQCNAGQPLQATRTIEIRVQAVN